MSEPAPSQNITVFMLIKTTPAWLALPPKARFAFFDAHVRPLLAARPQVRLRYFDAEFYTARCTDVMMWETSDQSAYRAIVEELRETLFWDHYFQIVEIVPAVEDAYADHYDQDRIA
ncbi:MAG: darcynin family protein [Pseudomonadota bacterium]|uniref:darcynin family protein n=1 Tax=unclassified Phenylobacterium TaxID=2640670 RepID=UPI0006F4BA7D|nr:MULTISPECIES: darcynin family protein [unclassified Phenylobacterium]KRB52386.1 darcynin [Phenylobacterium sp. Root700]MBT9472622.1 darcynin [Phenylobacterium sp.]